MIQNERDCRHEHVLDVARQMLTAARTAPKGKGIDVIEAALVTGEDIKKLSEKMVAMVEEHGMKFFLRDADNILQAECVIIIGTRECIDVQVTIRSPMPARPASVSLRPPRRSASREVSAIARVISSALVLSPRPRPSLTPQHSAATFLSAPASSTPTMSSCV